jgi:hypothetical protein
VAAAREGWLAAAVGTARCHLAQKRDAYGRTHDGAASADTP